MPVGPVARFNVAIWYLSFSACAGLLPASSQPEELLQPACLNDLITQLLLSLIDTAVNGKATSSRQVLTSVRNFPHECFTKRTATFATPHC